MICARCERPMVRGRAQPGHVRHLAHGYCRTCYNTLYYRKRRAEQDPGVQIDEIVIERVLSGDPVPTNKAERIEVTKILTECGLCAWRIAERLGCSTRSVVRFRSYLREVA